MSTITINVINSTAKGIVALAGGGQTDATILSSQFNRIDTVATTNDSCKLDAATAGKVRKIYNSSDNDCEIFPKVGERFQNDVNLLSLNESIILASKNGIELVCYDGEDGIFTFY